MNRLLEDHATRLLSDAGWPLAAAPDLSEYRQADREAARLQWLNRVVQEHHAVVDFADLLALLADIGAPYACQCALQRVLSDELRHVAYCREVVSWFGGSDDIEVDLSGFRKTIEPGTNLFEHTLERVTLELHGAELASLPIQRAQLQATTEPAVAAVLARLLEDEGMHAAIGKAIQQQLLEAAPVADRDRLQHRVRELEDAMRERMWAVYRSVAVGGPGRELGASLTVADVDAARARQ